MISIITLNLWRYYDFDSRMPNIVQAIQAENPDVVCFQEVQIDPSMSPFSQVELIQQQLDGYNYCIHSTIYLKKHQRGKKLDQPIQHGMAVLSKHPIMNALEFFLTPSEGEEEPRSVICFDIEKDKTRVKFANVHFANNEEWAKNQLKEFLEFTRARGEKRILAGDFNLFRLPDYDIFSGYKLSYNYSPYNSYPADNGCLDYVLIPDEFSFTEVKLLDGNLSDHKGLWVGVNLS